MRLAALAVAAVFVGCHPSSDRDTIVKLEERIAVLEQQRAHEQRAEGIDPNAPIGERVARLEGIAARYSDALEFLQAAFQAQKREDAAREERELDPEAMFAVDIRGAVAAGQVEGPAGAAVTIVKAFDFACQYCEKMVKPLHEAVRDYGGKVRVVYMNLVVHPDAVQLAHQYSCAAAKQSKYLAFKDAFFDKGFAPYFASRGQDDSSLKESNVQAIGKSLGLDLQKLESDAKSDACKQRINDDQSELAKFQINGTPALFFNGRFIGGAISKQELSALIDARLKEVTASGVAPASYYDKVVMAKGEKRFKSKKAH